MKNWTRSFSTVLGSLYHISNCRCKIRNPAADVFHIAAGFSLIQRPPVVEHLAIAIPLLREIRIHPHLFDAHPLQPSLTLAVFGILNVIACVQEGFALKIPVHIASVRCIPRKLDDGQPTIRFLLPFSEAVLPYGSTPATRFFFRFFQDCRKSLV